MSLATPLRLLSLAIAGSALLSAVEVDAKLPSYNPGAPVSGSIKTVGSDTMNNLMTKWLEGFAKIYPNVKFEVEGKGSGTAIPAMVEGTATFGPMSREAKSTEIDQFQQKFGYKPVQLATCIDMLAVYVHKDNPVKGMTLAQVDAIFSSTRKRGHKEFIVRWGQLGLTGNLEEEPISLYGRNSNSGTYGFFKEHALSKGDFKATVKEQPGSSAVVSGVAGDKRGIGYSGIGYKTADVKAVPLADKAGGTCIEATEANIADYPLTRFLLLTINHKEGVALDPLRAEFLKFIYSKQGQQIAMAGDFLPLDAETAAKALAKVGLKHE